MPTVHRAGNLRFVIYLDDHGPPHVHVFSAGAEAKVLLGSPDGRPVPVWARGFDRAGLRRAVLEIETRRAKLLAAWRRVHGSEEGRDRHG
ncbi:MAG: DUF4160 domain-containing protein [Nitrospirae bacterium]|nr:MAG: DUF4160 domain-containing protein [Nitrospirota bacterium]